MEILQLNAWGGRLESQILGLLKKERPDIICLQEAVSLKGGNNGGFFLTAEAIAEELSMNLAYAPALSFRFMNRTAAYGNAILSTLPFESQHTVFTRKKYIENFDAASDDYNIRVLHHVTIKTDEGPLNVLTHHGHHIPAHKNGDAETLRQCKLIADYVSALTGRVILTGDFNLAPHSESLEQLNSVLRNACIEYGVTTTRSPLSPKTGVCDYIFTSEAIDVQNFRVADELVSDHRALIMEFE